jgi:5-formyltetrahydrofolate cyclo-ligase
MNEKIELRKQIRNKLSTLSKEDYERKSEWIARNLFETEIWSKSTIIGITISLFPEVDTYGIIEKAWEDGKQVAVVKCVPDTKGLDFYLIHDFTQVEKGFYGLIEPDPQKTEKVLKEDLQLLIVPGLGFTKNGFRLGVGGGYYDRYLPDFKGRKISLAFEEQIVDYIPIEEHDYRVEVVVTEKEVIDCD